ncbi:hypothetical protein GGS20DRAFT_535382 [Poronia punctata]|nr:hypothetical protein GGS20DRAFT_535382 [Poronia punctata]
MSEVPAVSGHQAGPAGHSQTGPDADEVREYQKIIQFRDTVVSGKHPRIKLPASSVAKNATQSPSDASERVAPRIAPPATQPSTRPPGSTVVNGQKMGNASSFKANSQHSAVNSSIPSSAPTAFISGVSRPFDSGSGSVSEKPQIHPVLLEKSDDLVKAEIQIQRQRIEKTLKDQVEQRKATAKANPLSSEQPPDLDLSDVLAKALTVVQATAPPPIVDFPTPIANASEASDSFDENTFYSSQHDTPESRPSVPARDAVANAQTQYADPVAPATKNSVSQSQPMPVDPLPVQTSRPPQAFLPPNAFKGQNMGAQNQAGHSLVNLPGPVQDQGVSGTARTGMSLYQSNQYREPLDAQIISSDSRGASRSDNSGNTDSEQSADQRRLQNLWRPPNAHFRQTEKPLIRAHNLSPLAPQPSHVSPLAIARQAHTDDFNSASLPRVPAQVNSLRQENAVVISPESSPQGDSGGKKKQKKKNKRKADERGRDVRGSPTIKVEPRSPSPLAAPPFIRPEKRQRKSGRREAETIYDEPMLDSPGSQLQQGRYIPASEHVERVPQGYEVVDYPYSRQVRPSVAPVTYRPESPLYEERRPDGSIIRYVRRAPSPLAYADHYGVVGPRPQRAPSYSVANPDAREAPGYEREGRMSVRPYADRARSRSPVLIDGHAAAMPPPSAPPRRIVVDEYGREYLEPIRGTTVSRQSVMPSMRSDHEVTYERAPMPVAPRMPTQEIIGEDGIVYKRASPGYGPRRVITQPEYGTDFRRYRERDYSTQPMGLSHEFVQIRGATEHRVPEYVPREYGPRAASARPMEALPYDRLPSTRPDLAPRQYAASVRPEARREAIPHVIREYSARPTEMDVPPRAYSVRPVERYYEQPSREGDIRYVERPRAMHQEIVYPGNGPSSQVYQ